MEVTEQPPSSAALRGRRVVVVLCAVAMGFTSMNVAWQLVQGMVRFALFGRLAIYAWVCLAMYRGKRWARWVFVVLMAAGAINFGLLVPMDPFQVGYALAYLAMGLTALLSPNVQAHFG